MRTVVLAAVAVLALAVTGASQPASQATKAVAIKSTGFSPKSVTIATGDAVKWTNRDTKNHQVVANNGSFASAAIKPGKSYTHTFNTAGTFGYRDALHPSLTGKVVVKGPPPAVTIGTATPIIDYGQSTHGDGEHRERGAERVGDRHGDRLPTELQARGVRRDRADHGPAAGHEDEA